MNQYFIGLALAIALAFPSLSWSQAAEVPNDAHETESPAKAPASDDKAIEKDKTSSVGQIYIKIGEAKTKKSLLALPPFNYTGTANPKQVEIGADLFRTISNDLTVSTFFKMLPNNAFLENTAKTGVKPQPQDPNGFKFDSWKTLKVEFLILALLTN